MLLCYGVTPVQGRIRNCLVLALVRATLIVVQTKAFVATAYASIVVPHRWGWKLRLTHKRHLDLTALASYSFLAALQQQVSWTRSVFIAWVPVLFLT